MAQENAGEDYSGVGISFHIPRTDLKTLPYEAIEFAAEELRGEARAFRFLSRCLPDAAVGAKGQLMKCAEMLDRRADVLFYDSCEHVWKGWKNPGTPQGPGDYIEYCDLCGAEKQDD